MPILIDEKKMLDDMSFQFEQTLKTPATRFLDSATPTFTTYFHIDNDETSTDAGYKDVLDIIGKRSPIKYKKITELPLYGIEQIVLQLQDTEQGLDSNYEGEAIVLPNTIKPLENDFFMIPMLHDDYIFRVTSISYDSIMPDNYYKITFSLEYINRERVNQLEDQTIGEYTCILTNIGTDNKCIIESKENEKIVAIDNMYNEIVNTYLTIFYNKKHNCLLGELENGKFLYDPFQTEFVNKHSLFNKKSNLQTMMLTNQFTDTKRRLKYEKSIYRFIEKQDIRMVGNFAFNCYTGTTETESTFHRWFDKSVFILDIASNNNDGSGAKILSDEFVMSIKVNGMVESDYADIIQKYVRRTELGIEDIPLTLNDELMGLDASLELFFFTPIILYIIKDVVNSTLKK